MRPRGQTYGLLQFEHPLHQHPLLAGRRLRKWLLELPHELLPFLHLGIGAIGLGLCRKGEALVHFHDHEHARPEKIDLHILDAGVPDTLRDFGPDVFVMTPVFGDQSGSFFRSRVRQ